jgi:hypothetical protein
MRAAWTGEPVELDGNGWAARGNRLRPTPAAGPALPLWRGGNGPRAIAHAARACDGWMPFEATDVVAGMTATAPATLDTLAAQVRRFRELREEGGADGPGEVCFSRTHPRWFDEEARGVEDLGRLGECGVTWIETGLRGKSVAEQLEALERLVAVAAAAGVALELGVEPKEE